MKMPSKNKQKAYRYILFINSSIDVIYYNKICIIYTVYVLF